MSKSITVSYEGTPCYDILLEQNFHSLKQKLEEIGCQKTQKACIVTDSNLEKLHIKSLSENIKSCFNKIVIFSFPAGEENKTLETVQKLYHLLINEHFDRHDLLIAFGGGVTGDLTGFTAATFLRGINFIQIPTSLLSQVDSSIGGKTGVDFLQYKNMVGAFYQPKLVYMNLSLLQTLPNDQFISGIGEILKHGLIKSSFYFCWLKENKEKIMRLQPDILEEMIYQSCLIKRDVVERDPKEKDERALLNFGHTIGHAVEKLSNFQLYHGHCVGIGIAASAFLSCELGHITTKDYEIILETLKQFRLPTSIAHISAKEILAATKSDKKMLAGKIKFVLLKEIGTAYINSDLNDEQISAGIHSIINLTE